MRAKRPLNIKNIQYTTSSQRLGNYKENYEIVSTSGRSTNNVVLRHYTGSILPAVLQTALPSTTNVDTLIAKGASSNVEGNYFGHAPNSSLRHLDTYGFQPIQTLNNSGSKSIIVNRFSAPGGPEINSFGYLDAASAEYSVHNALPFRNLSVRSNGSGESTSIRVEDHLTQRRGLRKLLSNHCGPLGLDSEYGAPKHADFTGNSAITFDQIDGTIWTQLLLSAVGGSDAFSCSFWVKKDDDPPSTQIFLSFGEKIWVWCGPDGQIRVYHDRATTDGEFETNGVDIVSGTWRHVVVTFDFSSTGNSPIIYVDGESVPVNRTGGTPNGASTGWASHSYIGAQRPGTNGVVASLDEFAIWSRVLSSNEVKRIYNHNRSRNLLELAGTDPSALRDKLGLYYRMGGDRDTTIKFFDESHNGNDSVAVLNVGISHLDETKPSFHKVNRNTLKRVVYSGEGTGSFGTGSVYNNAFVTTPIPQSEFQYSWINNSLGYDYGIDSGAQKIYGYAPRNGIISSSAGFDSAINFPTSSQLYGMEL